VGVGGAVWRWKMQGGWIEDPAGMLVTMTGLVRRVGPGGRQEREKEDEAYD